MTRHTSLPATESDFPCTSATFVIPGAVGELELLTACPPAGHARPATAVICHPHPLHGGSMQNKVVHTLARGFGELGLRSVRFNFRGVGRSGGEYDHGVGEVEDLLAVLAWVRARRPQDRIWLAGFSFGSYVALQASVRVDADQLVLVAPPVNLYDFTALAIPSYPLLVIQGGADEVVPAAQVRDWVGLLAPPPRLIYLEGVSHFFHARLNDLRTQLTAALAGRPE
jgi:alpha/beta superfamily hydrolase